MRFSVGIDIGGTFTDTTILKEDGTVSIHKTPSTPDAPERGVLEGIALGMRRADARATGCVEAVVSATVGLNAIIERTGAPVGLLVTEGFEDILELGRVKMNDVFSLDEVRRSPLVPKTFVRGVRERLNAKGAVLKDLDRTHLVDVARELLQQGARALAVIFIHGYRNPVHECAAKAALQSAFPNVGVAISSEVWPQIREFERATVLVLNSYITPKVHGYLGSLDRQKAALGLACPLYVSASNGGLIPSSHAIARPITSLLSGPSAGVVAAIHLMRNSKIDRAITFDMGGTSADICILRGDEVPYAWGQEIEGLPISVPYVDVSAIGSGGGSIAYIDNLGMLRVGPGSAGAMPGPAAYDRGGTQATLTDAYLVSGFIDPKNFVGGDLPLNPGKARTAIEPIADRLGLTIVEAATGIIQVATSVQVAEITRLAAKKGIDIRDFTLVPFGGAGPTHACLLADELHIGRIAIPVSPGAFCALGAVLADFRLDYVKTVYSPLADLRDDHVAPWYSEIATQGRLALRDVSDRIDRIEVHRSIDVRYQGQGYEVSIPFERLSEIPELFRAEYQRLYGARHDDSPIDVISLRATVVGKRATPPLKWAPRQPKPERTGARRIQLHDVERDIPVFRRESLPPGWTANGPFLVDQADTTCLVTENWAVRVDEVGTMHLGKIG